MDIADKLCKLADLKREGHLTEQEFAVAKRQLLSQGNAVPVTLDEMGDKTTFHGLSSFEGKTYRSSRLTSGNFLFPDALDLVSDGIVFRKGSLFGSREEHINYKAVASFRITNGILFSNILIETTGGSQPILLNGLWKSEAKEIQDALRKFHGQS
jgi:hypothetical protein